MKNLLMVFGFLLKLFPAYSQPGMYKAYPVYEGGDLGLMYSPYQSSFRIWAPTAEKAELIFYEEGIGGSPLQIMPLEKGEAGTWFTHVKGDQKGRFYVFRIQQNGTWLQEVTDPYAKAVGVNGRRAVVIDLNQTNPPGWEKDQSPLFKNKTDAIIYELQIRDASIANNSGIKNKGKYKGLTETGAVNSEGFSTGLDHIKEMGVTHIHLMPCFDFYSLDETRHDEPQYNWGYDPYNYNVPDGFFSTDPCDGATRIREFKQMVQAFHKNGLRVVMDVVYNHTALTETSNFNQLVPGYYYRQTADGKFSNATACGNETASERPMMRKFMLESMKYWVQEYHIDGFRIDLMGVHDIETMNIISRELHNIKPDILLYGEGWTAAASPLPDSLRALKKYAYKLDRIAVFSDDIRDGIKGSVFEHAAKGFASGRPGMEESIKFGVAASCKHPQVNYKKVNYSKAPYAAAPFQTVTYCECHDNHVLWDKLSISAKDASDDERKEMYKLALSIVLTSQGIAFLHAGTEFLRTKNGVENSFESPDSINAIDWDLKTKNADVVNYIRTLIKIRKEHPAFRMKSAGEIKTNIRFLENLPPGVVAYTINGAAVNDAWKKILVVYNGSKKPVSLSAPPGKWKNAIRNNKTVFDDLLLRKQFELLSFSCSVYYID